MEEMPDKPNESDQAIADYSEAIRLNPKLAGAFYNRGNAWKKKGEYDKALADYSEAIRLNPKNIVAYINRGIAWFNKSELDKTSKTTKRSPWWLQKQSKPFQYSIRALLILTAAIAVLLALAVQAHFLLTAVYFILFSIGLTLWLRSVWPVLLFILPCLFALTASPVILRVREDARRNTCSSNIRQLALAMHNFESANRIYPSQNYFTGRRLGNVTINNVPGATTGGVGKEASFSFIIQLFPQFEEHGPDVGAITATNPFSVAKIMSQDRPNAGYAGTPIPFLQCPDFTGQRETIGTDYVQFNDPSWTTARKPMLMQYVAMGATTYDNLYRTAKATTPEPNGMIFSNKQTTTDDVADGLANTIMLCETQEEKYAVWMDGTTASVFGITADGQTTLNRGGSAAPYIPAANFGGTEDWQWVPSSMHAGMAHHAFGDGAVRAISDDIEADVYRALITKASKAQYGVSDAETADLFFDE